MGARRGRGVEQDGHFGAVFPNVIKLHDVGVLDELEDGHLALNGHGDAHLAIDVVWKAAIPFAQSGQAAILNQVCHATIDNLDGGELIRHAVSTQTDSS